MKECLYKNRVHILVRQFPDKTELIDKETLDVLYVSPDEVPSLQSEAHRGLVCTDTPFSQRPRNFVEELHKTRLQWLLDLPKKKARQKKEESESSVKKKPLSQQRTSKKNMLSKLNEMIAQKMKGLNNAST